MSTELSINTEYTGHGPLTLELPHEPNADTAFVYGENPLPPPVRDADGLAANYEWFGDVLIRAGMLHRWQEVELADNRLNNEHLSLKGAREWLRHSPFLYFFENEEGLIDPTDLAEARRLREGQQIMTLGALYCGLADSVRIFTEGEDVSTSTIGNFHPSHVFTRTLEPSDKSDKLQRVFNIGNWSRPVTAATLCFVPNSGEAFITLHGLEGMQGGSEGIQKQIVVNSSWARSERVADTKTPVAPHPIRVVSRATDVTYENTYLPSYSLDHTPAVVERASSILRRLPALQKRIKNEGEQD